MNNSLFESNFSRSWQRKDLRGETVFDEGERTQDGKKHKKQHSRKVERRLESSEKIYPQYLEKIKLVSLENMVQMRSSVAH